MRRATAPTYGFTNVTQTSSSPSPTNPTFPFWVPSFGLGVKAWQKKKVSLYIVDKWRMKFISTQILKMWYKSLLIHMGFSFMAILYLNNRWQVEVWTVLISNIFTKNKNWQLIIINLAQESDYELWWSGWSMLFFELIFRSCIIVILIYFWLCQCYLWYKFCGSTEYVFKKYKERDGANCFSKVLALKR